MGHQVVFMDGKYHDLILFGLTKEKFLIKEGLA